MKHTGIRILLGLLCIGSLVIGGLEVMVLKNIRSSQEIHKELSGKNQELLAEIEQLNSTIEAYEQQLVLTSLDLTQVKTEKSAEDKPEAEQQDFAADDLLNEIQEKTAAEPEKAEPEEKAAAEPENVEAQEMQVEEKPVGEDSDDVPEGPPTEDALADAASVVPSVSMESFAPGDILDHVPMGEELDQYFAAYEITEGDAVYNQIIGKSYRENNNIGLADLRYLKLIHYNFQHEVQVGELIVNAQIYEDYLNIFKELFMQEYEFQSMYLVDNYWTGDGGSTDSASIDVNNTSCFNYREVTGGSNLSNHAYGCAIDINPQQNPYVWYNGDGSLGWSHSNASPYIDRYCGDPHVVVKGDLCYNTFAKYGFTWGGEWSGPIDYQHFEKRLY